MKNPKPKTGSAGEAEQALARADAWARSSSGARYGEGFPIPYANAVTSARERISNSDSSKKAGEG